MNKNKKIYKLTLLATDLTDQQTQTTYKPTLIYFPDHNFFLLFNIYTIHKWWTNCSIIKECLNVWQ